MRGAAVLLIAGAAACGSRSGLGDWAGAFGSNGRGPDSTGTGPTPPASAPGSTASTEEPPAPDASSPAVVDALCSAPLGPPLLTCSNAAGKDAVIGRWQLCTSAYTGAPSGLEFTEDDRVYTLSGPDLARDYLHMSTYTAAVFANGGGGPCQLAVFEYPGPYTPPGEGHIQQLNPQMHDAPRAMVMNDPQAQVFVRLP
jgi:hypothetical protein